jgi:hypothetical protein
LRDPAGTHIAMPFEVSQHPWALALPIGEGIHWVLTAHITGEWCPRQRCLHLWGGRSPDGQRVIINRVHPQSPGLGQTITITDVRTHVMYNICVHRVTATSAQLDNAIRARDTQLMRAATDIQRRRHDDPDEDDAWDAGFDEDYAAHGADADLEPAEHEPEGPDDLGLPDEEAPDEYPVAGAYDPTRSDASPWLHRWVTPASNHRRPTRPGRGQRRRILARATTAAQQAYPLGPTEASADADDSDRDEPIEAPNLPPRTRRPVPVLDLHRRGRFTANWIPVGRATEVDRPHELDGQALPGGSEPPQQPP